MKTLRAHIQAGKVYRRSDLELHSRSIDRDLAVLTSEGALVRLAQGLYHAPQVSKFGEVPPSDQELVSAFLKSDDFLLISPNAYNSLGLGFTQLYGDTWVYNHKREGAFTLGGRNYLFKRKTSYPKCLTMEFLLVDALNNLDELAEDPKDIYRNLSNHRDRYNESALMDAVRRYAKTLTRRIVKDSWANKVKDSG